MTKEISPTLAVPRKPCLRAWRSLRSLDERRRSSLDSAYQPRQGLVKVWQSLAIVVLQTHPHRGVWVRLEAFSAKYGQGRGSREVRDPQAGWAKQYPNPFLPDGPLEPPTYRVIESLHRASGGGTLVVLERVRSHLSLSKVALKGGRQKLCTLRCGATTA